MIASLHVQSWDREHSHHAMFFFAPDPPYAPRMHGSPEEGGKGTLMA